jgi:threonine dehydrogenase-like Zn-dependent dehydrogenase
VGEFYVRSSRIAPGRSRSSSARERSGLSAVVALAARKIEPIIVSDYKQDRRELAKTFGAHVFVDPAERSPFEVRRELAGQRGTTTPPVVYECVGAPGLVQQLVDACDMWTRIYCAGGWYTDDTLSCTAATHKGVTIQFGGGPHAEGLVRHARRGLRGPARSVCRASAA